MAAKPFKKEMGRNHFQELKNEHLASFNHSQYFVEISIEYSLDQLLDPMTWGPQPRFKRGDFIIVMRADNEFFATFIVESVSAGYPLLRVLNAIERDAPARAEPLRVGDDGVEMVLTSGGAAHIVTHNSEIAAVRKTAGEADAALAALVAGNA